MYNAQGEKVWECTLDIYGKVRTLQGSLKDCPFRYQGQYDDVEIGLYYNRFRYYDPQTGNYISQDPIGLEGGIKLYGYVHDTNTWVDPWGLSGTSNTFVFRGDVNYQGGNVGLPLGSEADIMAPWEHVRRASNGESIAFTSFTEKTSIAKKFAGGKMTDVSKVSMEDLLNLQAEGKIKIHTPESVAEMMKNSGNKKLRVDANNVKEIMKKNGEILIEGEINGKHIKCV